MPTPGEILWYKDFEFKDRSKNDKLFVVLNTAEGQNPCLVLKTTSQPKRYSSVKRGCNPDEKVFFVPTEWENCFDLDTYIQLPQIFELSADELIRESWAKRINAIGSLSSNCFSQLRNCLKNFKEDISPVHWKLIFK